ncbi:hypothetical protein KEM56_006651 [Ascosphaera pollenicola]|nr:hypothetical protein KEM56_006651 [Ascosphaera pollenicola]
MDAKRKRVDAQPPALRKAANPAADTSSSASADDGSFAVQIVVGSYDHTLHGVIASIHPKKASKEESRTRFTDTFLFQAHTSAIRCLALSPLPSPDKSQSDPKKQVFLASGGTDERINLYSLSAYPPPEAVAANLPATLPSLSGNRVVEDPANRELGSLLHHYSTINSLCFPNRSKLLAAADDNTVSVTRTKDWNVVATIKAPRPLVQGRPTGDTAPLGGTPMGINSFAVHPSMKLMLSVGKGEKAVRLWNLVTGKKAGILTFNRSILECVKESKHTTGEGRSIVWNSKGEEFAVAFERGVVVFGIDSEPKCFALPQPSTKVHTIKYLSLDDDETSDEVLVISTEDGRVLFYSAATDEAQTLSTDTPSARLLASAAGKEAGQTTRVKAFEILKPSAWKDQYLLVTCGSDGAIRLWALNIPRLAKCLRSDKKSNEGSIPSISTLVGAYETRSRITCLAAFVMLPAEDRVEDELDSDAESSEVSQDSSDDSESE